MGVQIAFKNIESTDALKSHVEKKVEKIKKLIKYPVEVHVVLWIEHLSQYAEITCHAEHKELVATGESQNLYESIDQAAAKIDTQIRKEREKKKGHSRGHLTARANNSTADDTSSEE